MLRILLVIQDGYTFQPITGYNMAVRESGIKYYGILWPSFLTHTDLQDKHLPLCLSKPRPDYVDFAGKSRLEDEDEEKNKEIEVNLGMPQKLIRYERCF